MYRRALSIAIFTIFAGVTIVLGQNDHAGTVKLPAKVKLLFQKQYTGAEDVSWTKLDGLVVISFKKDGSYIEAFYNKEGKWARTETPIELSTLPPPIVKILNSAEFKGWHKGSAYQVESPAKRLKYKVYVYGSDWNEMELVFDAKGNRIIDNLN